MRAILTMTGDIQNKPVFAQSLAKILGGFLFIFNDQYTHDLLIAGRSFVNKGDGFELMLLNEAGAAGESRLFFFQPVHRCIAKDHRSLASHCLRKKLYSG